MSSDNFEKKTKKIDFLKTVGSNPDRKIEEIGRELGIGRTGCYKYINEFAENAVMTDNEPDFPRKLLMFYNEGVPENEEHLSPSDVEQLRPWIDAYYNKHLPPMQEVRDETINSQEHSYKTLSSNNDTPDMSTDAGYLRTLLMNAKFVHPSMIDRFLKQYDLNKENFDKDPLSLLEYMKHMFTPQQGENIFRIFQRGRGKFVYGADGQKPAMDMSQMLPLMMMMGGGQMNPAMMAMMGGQNDPNNMMNMLMLSMMTQNQQKNQQKQDQNEMFERLVQTLMLKMVGGSIDDKKPFMDMMGGMGYPGMPSWSVQEVLDSNGRVTGRNYVPNFAGMAGQPHQPDPILSMMLGKTMEANTALLMKMADSGKQPTDLLLGLIPHFRDQGNAGLQLSSMLETMNKIAPGFFDRRNEPGTANLDVYKLKFDTELAMQAQKIELAKMEHTWRVDEMDRAASNDNAKNWMQMIGTFGEKIVTTVGPAVLQGFGKGMLNQGSAQGQQMTPQQMQQIMQARQIQAAQAQAQAQQEQARQQQAAQAQATSQAQTQPTVDPTTIYLVTQLQSALQQSENDKKMMMARIQEMESQMNQPRTPQTQEVDERRLAKMSDGQLKQILQEISMSNSMESNLKTKIEALLSNRALMNSQPTNDKQEESEEESEDEGQETESVTSDQTKDSEEPMS